MLKGTAAVLAGALCLTLSIPAAGQTYPLPTWYFYGGGTAGNGAWNGSSTAPDNASLSVTINYPPQPPGTYELAVASSSTSVLVMAPHATYTLTFAAMVNGFATGTAVFVGDTASIAGISLQGSGWKNYTNSFTTGGMADPHVGQNLYAQFTLTGLGSMPGHSTASFTNIQFKVVAPRPPLAVGSAGPGQLELWWPTNFEWCVPESAGDLLAVTWEEVTNSRTVQGGQFVVPVGLEPGQRFFRLRVQ